MAEIAEREVLGRGLLDGRGLRGLLALEHVVLGGGRVLQSNGEVHLGGRAVAGGVHAVVLSAGHGVVGADGQGLAPDQAVEAHGGDGRRSGAVVGLLRDGRAGDSQLRGVDGQLARDALGEGVGAGDVGLAARDLIGLDGVHAPVAHVGGGAGDLGGEHVAVEKDALSVGEATVGERGAVVGLGGGRCGHGDGALDLVDGHGSGVGGDAVVAGDVVALGVADHDVLGRGDGAGGGAGQHARRGGLDVGGLAVDQAGALAVVGGVARDALLGAVIRLGIRLAREGHGALAHLEGVGRLGLLVVGVGSPDPDRHVRDVLDGGSRLAPVLAVGGVLDGGALGHAGRGERAVHLAVVDAVVADARDGHRAGLSDGELAVGGRDVVVVGAGPVAQHVGEGVVRGVAHVGGRAVKGVGPHTLAGGEGPGGHAGVLPLLGLAVISELVGLGGQRHGAPGDLARAGDRLGQLVVAGVVAGELQAGHDDGLAVARGGQVEGGGRLALVRLDLVAGKNVAKRDALDGRVGLAVVGLILCRGGDGQGLGCDVCREARGLVNGVVIRCLAGQLVAAEEGDGLVRAGVLVLERRGHVARHELDLALVRVQDAAQGRVAQGRGCRPVVLLVVRGDVHGQGPGLDPELAAAGAVVLGVRVRDAHGHGVGARGGGRLGAGAVLRDAGAHVGLDQVGRSDLIILNLDVGRALGLAVVGVVAGGHVDLDLLLGGDAQGGRDDVVVVVAAGDRQLDGRGLAVGRAGLERVGELAVRVCGRAGEDAVLVLLDGNRHLAAVDHVVRGHLAGVLLAAVAFGAERAVLERGLLDFRVLRGLLALEGVVLRDIRVRQLHGEVHLGGRGNVGGVERRAEHDVVGVEHERIAPDQAVEVHGGDVRVGLAVVGLLRDGRAGDGQLFLRDGEVVRGGGGLVVGRLREGRFHGVVAGRGGLLAGVALVLRTLNLVQVGHVIGAVGVAAGNRLVRLVAVGPALKRHRARASGLSNVRRGGNAVGQLVVAGRVAGKLQAADGDGLVVADRLAIKRGLHVAAVQRHGITRKDSGFVQLYGRRSIGLTVVRLTVCRDGDAQLLGRDGKRNLRRAKHHAAVLVGHHELVLARILGRLVVGSAGVAFAVLLLPGVDHRRTRNALGDGHASVVVSHSPGIVGLRLGTALVVGHLGTAGRSQQLHARNGNRLGRQLQGVIVTRHQLIVRVVAVEARGHRSAVYDNGFAAGIIRRDTHISGLVHAGPCDIDSFAAGEIDVIVRVAHLIVLDGHVAREVDRTVAVHTSAGTARIAGDGTAVHGERFAVIDTGAISGRVAGDGTAGHGERAVVVNAAAAAAVAN